MRLTKKATQEIQAILHDIDRGLNFIDSERTRILRLTRTAALPRDNWTSQEKETGVAIDKQIGSELCFFRNARQSLQRLLTPPKQEAP